MNRQGSTWFYTWRCGAVMCVPRCVRPGTLSVRGNKAREWCVAMGVLVEVEPLAVQEELAGKVESRHDDVLPSIRAIDFERDATYVVVADGGRA